MKKLIIVLFCIGIVLLVIPFTFDKSTRDTAGVLLSIKSSMPNVSWGKPQDTTEPTPLGNLAGVKLSGTLSAAQATLPHFENAKTLEAAGYKPDMSLSADGPGSSVWGYKKTSGRDTSIILLSYNTTPSSSNPNEPLQFNCPCQMSVSVFVSQPFTASTSEDSSASSQSALANPASVNCAKEGGTSVIMNGPNGQYGLCQFEDDQACEEWALFRGQCPVGGVKTTGYDTIEQKYCAWVGGKTLAVPNAQCTLPSGKTCSDTAVYNGTCSN